MERTPLSRAWELLKYARTARLSALIGGLISGFLYVMLVLLVAFFADLLVGHGQIHRFAHLTDGEQDAALKRWKEYPEDVRVKAIHQLGFEDLGPLPAKLEAVPAEQRSRAALANAILAADGKWAPIPGRATDQELADWGKEHLIQGPAALQAGFEHEYRWRVSVRLLLEQRIGSEAASAYQAKVAAGRIPEAVTALEMDRRGFGILGTVVSQSDHRHGRVVSTIASIFPWTWNGSNPNRSFLFGLLITALIIAAIRGAAHVAINEGSARASLEVVTRLRRAIYHQTARHGSMTLDADATEEAGILFTNEVNQVHEAIEYRLSHEIRYAVQFFLIILVAAATHLWLTLTFALTALIAWSFVSRLIAGFRQRSKSAGRVSSNRLRLLLESLGLMRLVKAYLMEAFNQSRVERQLADYANAQMLRSRGDSIARPLLLAMGTMIVTGILTLAGFVVLRDGLGVAGLAVLAIAFLSLYFPVRSRLAGRKLQRYAREGASKIYDFLDRRGDVATYPDAEFLPEISKGFEFHDVGVKSPTGDGLLLRHIDLKVRAGTRIGVVGANEDEKLALVSLLPRFIDPAHGQIKIDGRDVKWLTHDSLRSQIAVVLQNSLVFNDTVSNNIGCGDPEFALPQIIEAAKTAHAHQFIQRLPYGYETPIGDLARMLTPGEQFRIALARAILREPSLLVIEEPREPYDDDTRSLIDDTLRRVLPGKTVIYLPHRMSTLRECDNLVLLHEGRLVASGDHRTLIQENELYRHLYYLEFNPFAEQAPA